MDPNIISQEDYFRPLPPIPSDDPFPPSSVDEPAQLTLPQYGQIATLNGDIPGPDKEEQYRILNRKDRLYVDNLAVGLRTDKATIQNVLKKVKSQLPPGEPLHMGVRDSKETRQEIVELLLKDDEVGRLFHQDFPGEQAKKFIDAAPDRIVTTANHSVRTALRSQTNKTGAQLGQHATPAVSTQTQAGSQVQTTGGTPTDVIDPALQVVVAHHAAAERADVQTTTVSPLNGPATTDKVAAKKRQDEPFSLPNSIECWNQTTDTFLFGADIGGLFGVLGLPEPTWIDWAVLVRYTVERLRRERKEIPSEIIFDHPGNYSAGKTLLVFDQNSFIYAYRSWLGARQHVSFILKLRDSVTTPGP